MKRFPAGAAVILAVWIWGSGCGESIDGRLYINLVPFCDPPLEEIQDDIAAYCITVLVPDVAEPPQNCSGTLEDAILEVDEVPGPVEVVVEGLNSTGLPVLRGRSVPVVLRSGEDNVLSIPVALVGSFAMVAAGGGECPPLPYIAVDHAATVYPSGHVLITGSSSQDVDSSSVAFLIDPISGRSRHLFTPAILHRAYHSATLLEDGRVIVLGGRRSVVPTEPREIVVIQGGSVMMQSYSFTKFDPHNPPPLSFDVLMNERLLHTRTIHNAALFNGNQIVINDGESPAEMFLGSQEASGYVIDPGGLDDPFPVSIQHIVTTVVPLSDSRGALLGGKTNHNGKLVVSPESREVNFQPYNLSVIRRNNPVGVLLSDGRVMFLGGKEGVVQPESPVVIVDPDIPSLIQIFVDERTFPQRGFTATLLEDGRVFVVGGASTDVNYVPRSTFYLEQQGDDPTQWWALPGPYLNLPRANHTASRLPDGRLLVIGGLSTTADVSHEEVATSAEIIAF